MNNEKELEKSIDNNEWKSVENLSEMKKQFKQAAKNTLLKNQRMNIRIPQRDLESLKTKALEEGMPYQTLVSSVLHKYVTGKLIEKET
jgi:predicted DNA binding CopG/RHH family protein